MDYWHSSQNGGARKMSRMGSFSSSQVGVILQLKRERAQSVAKSRLLLSTVWLSKQLRHNLTWWGFGFSFWIRFRVEESCYSRGQGITWAGERMRL